MKSAEQKAKNVPAIRFAGFDNEWVNKIFRESFTYLQNNTLSRAELNSESGLAKNIHYGDVLVKFGECIDVAEEKIPFVSDAFVIDKFKNSFLQDGDIVIADTAEDETVGKCTEMQGVNDAILLSGLHTIPSRPKEKYGSKFLGYYLNSSAYRQQLLPLMQGVKVLSISKSALQETNLVIPKDNQEQQKVGSFFSNIDSLISLEQKKYDKLTQVKKSMLEKMFPKEGATVPEIRFVGFTGDWEEKKLGDTVLLRGRIGFRGYKETDLVPKGMGAITFSPADIDETGFISLENNKYLSWQKYDESPEIQVKVGDILFTKTASIGKVGYVQLLSNKATINPQFALLSPNENMNGYFIFLSVRNDSFMKKVKGITGGSSVPTMSQEKLKELTFLKTSIDEQNKIGSYFSHLDSLISLQQRKLEKLKNIKKSLLEKMFV